MNDQESMWRIHGLSGLQSGTKTIKAESVLLEHGAQVARFSSADKGTECIVMLAPGMSITRLSAEVK